MQQRRRTIAIATGLTAGVAGLCPLLPAGAAVEASEPEQVHVVAPAAPQHWDPLTDELWDFRGNQVVLTRAGSNPNDGVRRPFEYAIVAKGPELTDVTIDAEVRLDEPVSVNNRDVIIVWNYQGPKRFYYAHFSQDNTIYPHNGIFVVDNADRRRIDDQWTGSVGAPPAVTDADWHDVRVDHDATTGEIEVYVDGADEPLMTATDTTFSGGRVGFGSFDNFGRTRHFRAVGTAASSSTP
jgi:hypothetical protein